MIRILLGLLVASSAHASVQPVTIVNLDAKAPRWMYGEKSKRQGRSVVRALEAVKREEIAGRPKRCLDRIPSARAAAPSLRAWLSVVEMKCAARAFQTKKVFSKRLAESISRAERNPSWLISGPQKILLRAQLIESRFVLLTNDVKRNRVRAWQAVNKLLSYQEWMTKEQRAELFRHAGDLAFIEQKMKAARGFVLQSIALKNTVELQEKLTAIDKALSKTEPVDAEFIPSNPIVVPVADEASKEEFRLERQAKDALKKGNVVKAAEMSSRILEKHSGGRRALWAQKHLLQSYFKTYEKDKGRFFSAKNEILKKMKEADGIRLQNWAKSIFRRGHYEDSLELARAAVSKLDKTNRQKEALRTAAFSALYLDKFELAEDLFSEIIEKNAGSKEAMEATLRLALVYYRTQEYSKATTFFEKLLFLPGAGKHELTARYWLWRSFQKIQPSRAENERKKLILSFPLTYYGLRARAEGDNTFEVPQTETSTKPDLKHISGNDILKLPKTIKPKKLRGQIWMTNSQRLSWERMNLLLAAGWLNEAQIELKEVPPPQNAKEQFIYASFWNAALDYRKTINLVREAIPMPTRWNSQRYIRLSYPQEFSGHIAKHAKRTGIEENLLKGLIRQESSFFPKARSHANAQGLMQLLPSTAAEAARQTQLENPFKPSQLYDVPVNIAIGSTYLEKMLKRFGGNVPLALAAYNAGPTRLDRWVKKREVLTSLKGTKSSAPEVEIWIEEMPWSETRFYVKSILRNLLIYRLLDQGQVKLADPLWQ